MQSFCGSSPKVSRPEIYLRPAKRQFLVAPKLELNFPNTASSGHVSLRGRSWHIVQPGERVDH